MSILSDLRIFQEVFEGNLVIEPFVSQNVQPSSIDMTLSDVIFVPRNSDINAFDENFEGHYDKIIINGGYKLKPNAFIVGSLNENITLPNDISGIIHNRSSLIRMGIDVGMGSYINPGYKGKLPVFIKNEGVFNVTITPGTRICQLELRDVVPAPQKKYGESSDAKYHNEDNHPYPKLYMDKEYQEFLAANPDLINPLDSSKMSEFFKSYTIKYSIDWNNITEDRLKELGLSNGK